MSKIVKLSCKKRYVIAPNSECTIWLSVPDTMFGTQGIFTGNSNLSKRGVLLARLVVTVAQNGKIPILILNPTNEHVVLYRGKLLGEFSPLVIFLF